MKFGSFFECVLESMAASYDVIRDAQVMSRRVNPVRQRSAISVSRTICFKAFSLPLEQQCPHFGILPGIDISKARSSRLRFADHIVSLIPPILPLVDVSPRLDISASPFNLPESDGVLTA